MAELGESFDIGSVEPRDNFDPVPAAKYVLEIIESDVADLKSGKGRGITLGYKIVEGQYEGRRLWGTINFRHENEQTQRIGQQELGSVCSACGLTGHLENTDDLHGIPIICSVAIEVDKAGRYLPKNIVKSWAPYHASAPAPRHAPARQDAPAPAPAKAASGGAMPWRR
jgi:hypothetical protein